MENDATTKEELSRGVLWGYPDLVKKVFGVVGPALVEEREKRRTEREEAGQNDMTKEDFDIVLEVLPEVEDKTASVPPQLRPLEDESGPLITTHAVSEPEFPGQPEYNLPSLAECVLLTASDAEAQKPPSENVILQSAIGEGAIPTYEIEEVPSTAESNDEGPHIP